MSCLLLLCMDYLTIRKRHSKSAMFIESSEANGFRLEESHLVWLSVQLLKSSSFLFFLFYKHATLRAEVFETCYCWRPRQQYFHSCTLAGRQRERRQTNKFTGFEHLCPAGRWPRRKIIFLRNQYQIGNIYQ